MKILRALLAVHAVRSRVELLEWLRFVLVDRGSVSRLFVRQMQAAGCRFLTPEASR